MLPSLLSVATDISPLRAAGDLVAAIGFLEWGRAACKRRAWTRGAGGTFLPRWATILLIVGGLGFAAGFIASAYLTLVR